ncbi:putative arabinose efflux permease, MFS family [Candidatus Fervidibacteria bacterium JGI MDM2 JNZ-1-D12]
MLAAYLELWGREPVLRRILVISLFADIAFGALIPFVNFYLSDELKAPPHVTGFAFAGYLAVETLLKAPFGALSDRWGRKTVMLLGLLIAVTTTLLLGFVRAHYGVMLLFPVVGIGFAAFFPTIAAFVADYAPEEHRGGMIGILNLSYLTGLGVSAAVGFLLHYKAGTYRHAFFVTSALLVIASILVLALLPSIKGQGVAKSKSKPQFSLRPRFVRLPALSRPVFILAGIFAISQFAASMQVPIIVPYAKQVLRLTDLELGLGIAIAAGALALVAVPVGRISDDIGRETSLRIALASATVALATFPFARSMFFLSGLGLLIGFAWLLAFPAALALVSEVVTEQERGAAVGLIYGGQGVGAIVGAPFGGIIAELTARIFSSKAWGLRVPLVIGAVALSIAFLMTFWLSYELSRRPVEAEENEP